MEPAKCRRFKQMTEFNGLKPGPMTENPRRNVQGQSKCIANISVTNEALNVQIESICKPIINCL